MTITQDVIKLTNKNLYWTNILLIPSIIIILLIVSLLKAIVQIIYIMDS